METALGMPLVWSILLRLSHLFRYRYVIPEGLMYMSIGTSMMINIPLGLWGKTIDFLQMEKNMSGDVF